MEINVNINKKTIQFDFVFVTILFFATILRFYHLSFQDIWLDEIHTLKESDPGISFSESYQAIMFREGIPHFYFLIVRFFLELFGNSIFIARSVSAISGLLSVYFIYKLGKEIFNKNAGYIAAILLTVNLFHIEYSQDARSYTMLALFTIITFYRLILFLKNINLKNAIYLGLFCGLITNCHPIGLLNVGAIYFLLFLAIFFIKSKPERVTFVKFSFISGIVFLIVFYPVYRIVEKVSEYTSFWVPPLSVNELKNVFLHLTGKSEILFFCTLFFFFYFLFCVVRKSYKLNRDVIKENKILTSFVILFVWFAIEVGVIIIKSYIGISIVLSRYFIAVLPAMILILAIGIELIRNNAIKIICLSLIVGYSLYNIFITTDYYNRITKTQFKETTDIILKRNVTNDKVVSSWGWLMSYFLNKDPNNKPTVESTFLDYITSMRNNAIKIESFWYIDGNSRPYNLSQNDEQFLLDNFNVESSISKYDVWTKHYVLKTGLNQQKMNPEKLGIKDFTPLIQDGQGNMMFFENSTVKSNELLLSKGNYEFIINGISLPEKPIKGENAHLRILINGNEIENFYLNEYKSSSNKIATFSLENEKSITIKISFDNDLSIDGLDRNACVYSIKLIKK